MGVGGGLMFIAMHPSSHNKYINNYAEMQFFGVLGDSVDILRGFFFLEFMSNIKLVKI